jgi:hypothetical protein
MLEYQRLQKKKRYRLTAKKQMKERKTAWEMFNCSNCNSLKKLVDTKMPTAQRMSSS